MGKGHKPIMVLAAREKKLAGDAKGCNSPQGCLLNEDPPIDCSRDPNFVKVICDNDKCSRNQYLHQQCYDHWEDKVIVGVQKSQARTRDWTDDQVRRGMWSRIWDVSYRYFKCVCGGYLKRAEFVELAQPPQPQPQQAAAAISGQKTKPKKTKQAQGETSAAVSKTNPLPKLNQSSKNVYTNNHVSPWTAAGGRPSNLGAASKPMNTSMENLHTSDSGAVQDNYIPGLFVDKGKKEPAKQRQKSISSNEDTNWYDPKSRSQTPLKVTAEYVPDGHEEDWHVITSKKGKADLVPWYFQNANDKVEKCVMEDKDDGSGDNFRVPVMKEPDVFVLGDEYVEGLEAHIQLSDPNMPYSYGRDRFEIQCLLDEMNSLSL